MVKKNEAQDDATAGTNPPDAVNKPDPDPSQDPRGRELSADESKAELRAAMAKGTTAAGKISDAERLEIEQRNAMRKPTRCRMLEVVTEDGDIAPAVVIDVLEPEDGPAQIRVCAFDPVFGPRNYLIDAANHGLEQPRGTIGWQWPGQPGPGKA